MFKLVENKSLGVRKKLSKDGREDHNAYEYADTAKRSDEWDHGQKDFKHGWHPRLVAS